ncbi:helix-turn-helix domain-containing protein [Mucilaginibacter antarcticus]
MTFADLLLKEFTDQSSCKCELLYRYFRIFLIHVSSKLHTHLQTERRPRNLEIINNFKFLVEENFKTKKMVAEYAEAMSVTPNYLNEVVKKCTGYSAGHHIRQRIAKEAQWQAMNSNSCMKGIAYDLGFYDLAHFSKFFKNTTGVNFSQFKSQDSMLQTVA